MPSPQLRKLIESYDQPGGDPDAGQEEVIAAYRQLMDDCAVIFHPAKQGLRAR